MYSYVAVWLYKYYVIFKYQFCVHCGVLVHEGNVVTVDGGIMHEPKASALSTRDHYCIA